MAGIGIKENMGDLNYLPRYVTFKRPVFDRYAVLFSVSVTWELGPVVGTSLIDAHVGGVGVMESVPDSEANESDDDDAICQRMALVCGTFTCLMAVSRSKLFIPVPGLWLTEGRQSATGALLDYIVVNYVASTHLPNQAVSQGKI
ncbi:hypothetical protein L1987_02002 [Smallanthus sonchifolius]|uniref:Uncharacterized protein n=1 Tax=Smallanthus sonchifolius TaxID=185202 RepID=A0ACB9K6M1_9ASTR|nr:hypothetical protein L1987_02002 [Smallanthus sonchifolius]